MKGFLSIIFYCKTDTKISNNFISNNIVSNKVITFVLINDRIS